MIHAKQSERGFTIIELMIAMMVFSVILLVVTAGIMRFTKQYYKGVISGQTQNTARAIIDDLTRSIQFNGGNVTPLKTNASDPATTPPRGYCIGNNKMYSFRKGYQVKDNGALTGLQSRHGLVSESVSGCSSASLARDTVTLPLALTGTNSREMLGNNMRLGRLSIESGGVPSLYVLSVKVLYGDNELLCSPSVTPATGPGGCAATAPVNTTVLENNDDIRCKTTTNAEFCAVSELKTTINKRLN